MREFVVYTAARIGLFVATYALVAGTYLLVSGGDQLPLLWPVLVAAVISSVASVKLLRHQRERFAAVIDQRARSSAARAAERERAEHPTE